ncbi:hypothetical protein U472_10595 [Orenia metallireducens]|uniref:Uncharacterized protein n=1 Tax=Orenia metallireducens TaxID=1413210 RepID=A0A1C0A899_9FIRM|nr:hypothetical protein [Orenia metallireducens]OCL26441.1 hypothetical protein U472_10595 [Orenia metallireducens]
MNEKIKIIQQTLEVNQEEAETALKLAENDLERALYMGDYVARDYILLQIKFSSGASSHNKNYGLIGVVWNGKEGEFINNDVALNDKDLISNIELKVDPQVFIKALQKIKDQENFSLEYQIKKGLEEIFNPTVIFKIFKLTKEDNIEELNIFIKEKLMNILEGTIDLELHIELMTKAKLRSLFPEFFQEVTLEEVEEDNSKKEEKLTKGDLNINLSCVPIISATKGRKISELNIGDKLKVKITDQKEIGQYLNKLLKNSSGTAIGVITKMAFNEKLKRYSVVVQFGPNIYGNLIVEPEVKIATTDYKTTSIKENDRMKINKNNMIISSIIIIIIILAVILYNIYYL